MQKPFCEDTLTITPKNNLINNNDNKDLPWCTEDTQHAQSIWWATVTMRNSDIKRGLIFLPNLHESWVKAVKTSLSYHSIKCTFLEIYVSKCVCLRWLHWVMIQWIYSLQMYLLFENLSNVHERKHFERFCTEHI